ncbi:MAG: trigger factor family protein, partial [Bacteroidales bacterium]|nr:trigger factor family protein [Candidatus Cacconaster merdequi]
MNVRKKQIDELNLQLTVKVAADDYAAASKKKTAELRRNAEFKGFRKGMVPASLIQRVYGERILVESVNEIVGTSLDEYIKKNKLNILGEPLASEKQKEQEWKDGNDFEFLFDVALRPELNFEVEKTDEVPQYSVTVAAEDKKKMTETLKKIESEKKDNKEPKTDEELEKEASKRLSEQYKQEAEWRVSKDIRNYFIEKSAIKLPEDFLKRWLLAANSGKVTKEQVDQEFPAFVEDFKWQMVRGYLMKKFDFKVEKKDLEEAGRAFVTYQYAMYGIGNVPEDIIN